MIPEKIGEVQQIREAEASFAIKGKNLNLGEIMTSLYPDGEKNPITHQTSRRRYFDVRTRKGSWKKRLHFADVKRDDGESHFRFKSSVPGAEPPKGFRDKYEIIVSFPPESEKSKKGAKKIILRSLEAAGSSRRKPPISKDNYTTIDHGEEEPVEVAIYQRKILKGPARGKYMYVGEVELKEKLIDGQKPNYAPAQQTLDNVRQRLGELGIKTKKNAPTTYEWIDNMEKKYSKKGKTKKRSKRR